MSDSQTLDLTNISVPNVEEVVEDVEDVPDNEVPAVSDVSEEAAEEPVSSEAEVVEEASEEPVSSEVSEDAEEPVVTTVEPVVSSPEPSAPVEQVVSDIREILADVPAPTVSEEATLEESSDSNVLTDDLKQRIAELDYLRELCVKWVDHGHSGKTEFLTYWENKSILVDSNVNYEEKLIQLEKMPELIIKWVSNEINFIQNNHFQNINDYTLEKPLFSEDQSVEKKIEVLEQLVTLLTDCANGKMSRNQIIKFINNLY